MISSLIDTVVEHQGDSPISSWRASMHMQRMLMHIIERDQQHMAHTQDEVISDVLACIADHYHENLCVDDLAAAAGLQRSRFAQRFKEWSGRPPMSFLHRYRIDRAAEYIDQQPQCVLEDVATACGFADAFSLSKAFKCELDLSPKAYRERRR